MGDIRFLTVEEVQLLHIAVMEWLESPPAVLRGGGFGALESAVLAPQQLAHYEGTTDVVRLAAVLGVRISQAQAYVDGNKRTAYIALDVFLRANRLAFSGDSIALAQQLETVADRSHELDAATHDFEAWLRANTSPLV